MNQPPETDLLRRLEFCTSLPSPPGVAIRIIKLNQNPDVNIRDVVDVIRLDPAISAKLIRVANSPLYARQRKTENLRQAINLFGSYNSLTMALSFSVISNLRGDARAGIDYPLFWRRSLISAMTSQLLGNQIRQGGEEDLFLAGLIQDIGMLALARLDDNIYQGLGAQQSDHQALQAHEMTHVGMDHAEVGAWLLERWNFPAALVNAVGGSHEPLNDRIDPAYCQLAKVVSLASEIADVLSADINKQGLDSVIDKAHGLLSLDRSVIETVLDAVIKEMQAMAALFEVNIGDSQYIESIAEQAREMLMLRSMHSIHETQRLEEANASLITHTQVLEDEKRRDHLTQLFNRLHFDEVIEDEFGSAIEYGWPLTLAFVDIDHFKTINDVYGHQVGDEVLKHVSGNLIHSTRGSDIIFRYGGEEFVILLTGTGGEGSRIQGISLRP